MQICLGTLLDTVYPDPDTLFRTEELP